MNFCLIVSGENDNKSVFVGVARRIATENIREMPSGQGCETNQWLTRHELDGQITYSDPRFVVNHLKLLTRGCCKSHKVVVSQGCCKSLIV